MRLNFIMKLFRYGKRGKPYEVSFFLAFRGEKIF